MGYYIGSLRSPVRGTDWSGLPDLSPSVARYIQITINRLAMLVRTWNRLVGFTRPFTERSEVIISLTIPVSILSHTVENISTMQNLNAPRSIDPSYIPKNIHRLSNFPENKKVYKIKIGLFHIFAKKYIHNIYHLAISYII